MPARTVTNPTAAYGYPGDLTTGLGAVTMPLVVGGAGVATAPSCVNMSPTGGVNTSGTGANAALNFGIALETGVTGDVVPVVVLGIAENVPCDGAVAAGDILKRSAVTAGRVATAAVPVTGDVVGTAINAASGGTVDVWVNAAKVAS